MRLQLHVPADGFYRGTRFDRSGIFESLVHNGVELCAPWFENYSPFMHDAVQGPAEEFSMMDLGRYWLKPGVGLLEPDGQPYDRFKLYKVADEGRWEVSGNTYRHILEGYYDYTKEVRVLSDRAFEIRHFLTPFILWEGTVYNHNFFTMGKLETGPSRLIDFPFKPCGDWRAQYDSVGFTDSGIRFSRRLEKGESVFTGNIHKVDEEGMPYDMILKEGPLSVHITGDIPVTHTVLWANHRIACLEPYNRLSANPGETIKWNILYQL